MTDAIRLGDILPEVLGDIERRCNRYRHEHGLAPLGDELKSERKEHARRVFQAAADFLTNRKKRANRQRQPSKQKALF